MSKKTSRAKAAPARKPANPTLVKLANIFSVVAFALFPILVGAYFLAMALGGFLYNNQQRFNLPPFVRSLYGIDMPAAGRELIAGGLPEDVAGAYKAYGDTQYELDAPVMLVAYGVQPQSLKVVMDKFPAVRGAWRGGSQTLAFSVPGAEVQPGAETRTDEWKDSMTGRTIDVYPWVTYQVRFDESALHTYLEAEASLEVTYAQPVKKSRDWTREAVALTRPLRFYVVSPDELEQIHKQMPRPDNIRLPLMNPLNPVFWGLILVGSGVWILRSLKQSRTQ